MWKSVLHHVFRTISQKDGHVMALRQVDGEEIWSINCGDITNEQGTACTDVIEAESSLSPLGLVLYYGDIYGNVKAIQLGESAVDTPAPTEFPGMTSEPTIATTETPSDVSSSPPSMASLSPPTPETPAPVAPTPSPVAQETPSPTVDEEIGSGSIRPSTASLLGVLAGLIFWA